MDHLLRTQVTSQPLRQVHVVHPRERGVPRRGKRRHLVARVDDRDAADGDVLVVVRISIGKRQLRLQRARHQCLDRGVEAVAGGRPGIGNVVKGAGGQRYRLLNVPPVDVEDAAVDLQTIVEDRVLRADLVTPQGV